MRDNVQEKKVKRKRQWGTEKRTHPLPKIHDKPSTLKISFNRLAIVATISFWVLYVISTVIRQFFNSPSFEFTLEAFAYVIVVTFLTFSSLMYLVIRQGALERFSKHSRIPRSKLDEYFSKVQPSITVLVPSYSEETDVIRKTLMSAALQEYPSMRIVLLIDDNPNPEDPEIAKRLEATRNLGKEIMDLFLGPRVRIHKAFNRFEQRYKSNKLVDTNGIKDLISEYQWIIKWLHELADKEEIDDHVDTFYAEQVIRNLANDLSLVEEALSASREEQSKIPKERIKQLYQRLIWIFDKELETFERKKFISLSHEANKAMNLNSYIGLMGGAYMYKQIPSGTILVPTNKGADVSVPDSDFVLTLDADSMLLREYCLRLVYFLEQPINAQVAVIQTPYSSFRGAGTRIERLASATTDIQHILHQGMAYYGASFWVGANAIVRKSALEDIGETEWVNGFEIHRYIQDRTVIEDTESSIDLTMHGWKLVSYPERLSYSATPPDFGSLVVQRRRWANGGLLILPKFLFQIKERKRRGEFVSQMEILIRINYMASIAWSSFGLILLLAFPYDSTLLSPLILLAALPYFLTMASDLKSCGYKRSDIFRIYGFNLILLPVNLAGVFKSIQQGFTGKKIPFARTPKIKDRTITQILFIIIPLLIVAFSLFTLWRDWLEGNWGNAIFAGFNALVASWAIIAYIGIWHMVVDLWHGITSWLYVEVKDKKKEPAETNTRLNWESVLYYGDMNETHPHTQMVETIYAKYKAKKEHV